MVKNTKSIIQFFVLLGIGILLIWLSLRQITPTQQAEIFYAFETADYFWVIVSIIIAFFSHFFRAFRWNYLLQPLGQKTKLVNANCYVLVGYLANYGIPRMGEISRCTLATKYDKVPFEIALGTVITERIVDFILFLIIFVLTLLVQFSELIGLANKWIFDPLQTKLSGLSRNPVKLTILIVVAAVIIIAFLLVRKKLAGMLRGKFGGIIKGLADGIGSIRNMERPFRFIVLSLLIWLSYFYSLYACFFALNGTSHLGQKECLTLLLFGTFGVIFSPGGLGAYPYIISSILIATYGLDKVPAIALPWLVWTSQFVLIVVLGIISLIVLPLYNRNKNVVS
ncbi:MAG: lysylphosphatidylglycerol synthase transmembrane domain-containing protein [Bacteroidia bacterium]